VSGFHGRHPALFHEDITVTVRLKVLAGLALAHLVLVVCGAFDGMGLLKQAPGGPLLRLGTTLSGADTNFGFFAPAVASSKRPRFVLTEGEGQAREVRLDEAPNHEVRVRAASPLHLFLVPELRDPLAASRAARAFDRHPQAHAVTVRVEEHVLPTMKEYREGKRPQWQPIYDATFARDADEEHSHD
jgi:hypothetical protein